MVKIILAIVCAVLVIALALLIRRYLRQKKQKRLSPVRFCENCGKRIRRDERTWYWHGAHVCLDCRKRLGEAEK